KRYIIERSHTRIVKPQALDFDCVPSRHTSPSALVKRYLCSPAPYLPHAYSQLLFISYSGRMRQTRSSHAGSFSFRDLCLSVFSLPRWGEEGNAHLCFALATA